MKIGKYKINSSVIIASTLALVGAVADLLSSGWVVESIAQMMLYFLQQPESFKPHLMDKIYQALLTFLPLLSPIWIWWIVVFLVILQLNYMRRATLDYIIKSEFYWA